MSVDVDPARLIEREARRQYEIEYAIEPGESSKWPQWGDLTENERAAWRRFALKQPALGWLVPLPASGDGEEEARGG